MLRNLNGKYRVGFIHVFAAFLLTFLIVQQAQALSAKASNWPMWRYDANRSANSPSQLPDELHLIWKRQLETPKPAWSEEQYKLQFDKSYEPVAANKLLFIASMVNDSVKAYDTETGKEKWAFYSRGPVRFAPVWYNGKVYFTSDDGYLYCLKAENGKLIWEKKLAPADNNRKTVILQIV